MRDQYNNYTIIEKSDRDKLERFLIINGFHYTRCRERISLRGDEGELLDEIAYNNGLHVDRRRVHKKNTPENYLKNTRTGEVITAQMHAETILSTMRAKNNTDLQTADSRYTDLTFLLSDKYGCELNESQKILIGNYLYWRDWLLDQLKETAQQSSCAIEKNRHAEERTTEAMCGQ